MSLLLLISSLCFSDLSTYQAVKLYFNASDAEMHWFPAPDSYWQVGGYRWNQPVRGRGYVTPFFGTGRIIHYANCGQNECTENGDQEVCGCDYSSCRFF